MPARVGCPAAESISCDQARWGCIKQEAKTESFTPGFRISPEGKFLESYSLDDDAHAIAADWAEVQRAWNISRPSWHGKCSICSAQESSHETCVLTTPGFAGCRNINHRYA